jgi:hypothetical protein
VIPFALVIRFHTSSGRSARFLLRQSLSVG